MEDRGRVVVVSAGFALWIGGRCTAAARWADVQRLRANRCAFPPTDALSLVVELVDGSMMELHEEAPGFDAFLDRAAVALPALAPYTSWHALLVAAPGEGLVVFERPPRRK
jgi:hypothetical protein